jgi:hypothetical protein
MILLKTYSHYLKTSVLLCQKKRAINWNDFENKIKIVTWLIFELFLAVYGLMAGYGAIKLGGR